MTEQRRLVDRVTADDYLVDLEQRPVEELRTMREEARTCENEVSFERRLAQGRIDILRAELDRRFGREPQPLVDMLKKVLADQPTPRAEGLPARARDRSIPRSAGVTRRRVEEIAGEQALARLPDLDVAEIERIVEALVEHERHLSARRKRVHEVMDALQAEMVRRYRSGEADPTTVLG